MSETITSIRENIPLGLQDQYEKMEFKQYKSGEIMAFGYSQQDEEWQPVDDEVFLEAMGHDPAATEEFNQDPAKWFEEKREVYLKDHAPEVLARINLTPEEKNAEHIRQLEIQSQAALRQMQELMSRVESLLDSQSNLQERNDQLLQERADLTIEKAHLETQNREKDERIVALETQLEQAAAARTPVQVREGWAARAQRRLTGELQPQYYVDGTGRYYYERDNERIYVAPTELEDRPGLFDVLGAVGALALAGYIGYAISKSGGHASSVDLTALKRQETAHHLQEMQAISAHEQADKVREAASLQAINANEHKDYLRDLHAHRHDLRAIHGIHNEIARDHAAEMRKLAGFKEHVSDSGLYWSFRYPWDWAANKVGTFRAESWLHTLASRASQHGHHVRWIFQGHEPNGSIKQTLQIDGTSNAGRVIQILQQYQ